jgi:uncharacterized glyoxalase superfamily protein PhnB
MPNFPFTQTLAPYLTVRSIEESYQYYTRVLGFMPGFAIPGEGGKLEHAEVTIGNVHIMFGRLDKAKTMAPPAMAQALEKGVLGAGVGLYINLGVANIDAYHRQCKERGAKILAEPETKFYGDRCFLVADPDGYMIWFAQTVAEFDPSKMPKK